MRKAWGIARTGMLENWKGSQYGWGSQARASKKHSDLKGREEPDRVGHLRSVKGFGYSVAAEWYQKAAEQGYAQAQNNLGVLYAEGHGVEKNMDKAKELITQAAEQGCEDAQENLKNFK